MGHEHRRRDYCRSGSAGRLHGDRGLRPRVQSIRGQEGAEVRGKLMPDRSYLAWPFFDESHRALQRDVEAWRDREWRPATDADANPSAACKEYVSQFGRAGWLKYAVPRAFGGALETIDVRSLCLIRETLGYASGLAEFAFAMQGLGAGPITLFASDELKQKYLPGVAAGTSIAAFAVSEAEAGSDLQAMKTTAIPDGADIVINGEKTWISNAGIASHYVVFCRWPEGGDRSFVALVVEAGAAGLEIGPSIGVMARHQLGTLTFRDCRVSRKSMVGDPGKGMRVALGTLDLFRTTVGGAALGFARRAFDEALQHARRRVQFGRPLAEFQLTEAAIAEMATSID